MTFWFAFRNDIAQSQQNISILYMKKITLIVAIATFLFAAACKNLSQSQQTSSPDKLKGQLTVGFYNLENVFDATDDPKIDDSEFLPTAAKLSWTEEIYALKLSNMADAISKIGDDDGPELLGLVEVENPSVTEKLMQQAKLQKHHYKVVQENSLDARGIDVAFAYDPAFFTYVRHKAITPKFTDPKKLTRDFLLVEGKVGGNNLYVIVNHWPSRRGAPKNGVDSSALYRGEVATQVKRVMDSLMSRDKAANVILMGDFNDDPKDSSIFKILAAQPNVSKDHFYNPMHAIHESGRGTLPYNGKWNLFDQFILSPNLTSASSKLHYVANSANIFNPDWLKVGGESSAKDYPKRFIFKNAIQKDGHSDHFPVYMQLSVNQ